jgi:hypothetical protein
MSNKTQLQTNNTNLDALISRVNAAKDTAASLPEAGSGGSGGGSIETCTITFDNISWGCPIVIVSAMVVENGIYQTYTNFSDTGNQLYTITIPNVVCGSEIGLGSCFDVGYGNAPYIEISGTASFNSWNHLHGVNTKFMTMTFTAPSVPNENCTISFDGNV